MRSSLCVWSLMPFRLAFSYSTVWYVSRKKCSEYWYRKWIWTWEISWWLSLENC